VKATFAIILSLIFALHGNAMSCLDGLCQSAVINTCCCEQTAAAEDNCCSEIPAPTAAAEDCHTECELDTHRHQTVVLAEQNTQISLPSLQLLAVVELPKVSPTTDSQRPTHTIEAPPLANYSVGYCVWRL